MTTQSERIEPKISKDELTDKQIDKVTGGATATVNVRIVRITAPQMPMDSYVGTNAMRTGAIPINRSVAMRVAFRPMRSP